MIAKMLKTKVFLLENDYEKVLESLQKRPLIMIDEKYHQTPASSKEDEYLRRIEKMIEILEGYVKKKGLFDYESVSYEEFNEDPNVSVSLLERAEKLYQKKYDLKIRLKENIELLNSIRPFKGLKIPTLLFDKMEYVIFKAGYLNEKALEALSADKVFEYQLLEKNSSGQAIALVYEKVNKEIADQFLLDIGFLEIELLEDENLINASIANLTKEITELEVKAQATEDKLAECAKDILKLKILADLLINLKKRNSINLGKTESSVYFEGWIVAKDKENFENAIKEATKTYEIEFKEPVNEDYVPTATTNGKIIKPFESLTNMYSVPQYKEIDPNPLMFIWYWIFFGMMMGDIGYGLLIIIGGGLFLKLKRPKGGVKDITTIFFYSGFSALGFGIVFGSFFGEEFGVISFIGRIFGQEWPAYLLNPLNNPLEMLIFAIVIGALHLSSGLVMKMLIGFKQKDSWEIIGGLSWILVLIGSGLLALGMFMDFGLIPGAITMIFGFVLVFLYSGRGKKIGGRITSGLGGIYNATGYLSDVLSYSRLLALALATAVIGSTMNLLAGMTPLFFPIIIYLIGHSFNLIIGLLSAYVQTARLQYLELFGKFFEGGGYEFTPLRLELKYLDHVEIN
ncbi:MAG: hypothetical protein FWE36_05305 [Erysipelotrichales bacterium]|nr:hypothetical protein [Erysipelotrichales bacterium]